MSATPDTIEADATRDLDVDELQDDPELPPAHRDLADEQLGRRGFMKATAGAAATVALLGAGVNPAAAQVAGLDFSSKFVHDPWIEADVTIGEHNRGEREMSDVLQFINDNGEVENLRDYGGKIRPQDEDDVENDVPYNPVTLRADRIDADTFGAMPRGEEYDDDSDSSTDDVAVTVLDSDHWSKDETGGGTLTISDVDSAAGGDAVQLVSASNDSAGNVVKATFKEGSDWEFQIDSGLGRKYLQIGVNVNTLPAGTEIELAIGDGTNYVTAYIDPSADATADSTIATGTGDGQFHQVQLGDLSGIGDLSNISEIEVRITEGNADVEIFALDVERESRLTFGTQAYTDTSGDTDELDEQTIRSPSGEYSIVGLDTLGTAFEGATLVDVKVDAQFNASGLPEDHVAIEWADADRYDSEERLRKLVTFDLPTAFDLGYANMTSKDTVLFPGSRYVEVGFENDFGDDPATIEMWDDDDVSLTGRTSTYSDNSIDDDVTITSSVSADQTLVVAYDYLLSSDERSDAEDTGGAVAAAGSTGGGGLMSWFSGFRGIAAAVVTGVLGYVALIRRRATGE